MTHPINAAPTFQSTLQVPDDGDPAQATAPGTPPELATVEEIAQTVLDNTKALETWLASTCFPASDNNALAPATFDPRIITRMWSRPSGFADGSAIKIDDSIDWRDRDVFVLFKELGGSGCGRDEGGAHLQNSATVEHAWGYLGTGGLDAAASDPAVTGNPPIIEAGKFCVRVIPPDVRLYANADTGHLWLFNNSGAAAYVELWIFATGKTTTGDGGSASADGSTTIVGGGSLPGGTDGGVLARVAGAWVSTGAGTAGQHLKSNGSGAPTWETPSGGGDTPPTGAQWYDAMKIALATPSALGGDYTTGIRFRVLSNRSITGAKFYWAGSATSLVVKVWQGGVEIASKSVVASGGAGDYTATFASPVALVTGTTYTLSIYDTSTAEYTANSSSQRQSPEFGAGWVRLNGYAYAGGDAEPTSGAIISNVMLLAPLF